MIQITYIKEGSEKAFTNLYVHYHVKLYNFFLKKTKSDDVASELVQITFIKLWRFRHTLSEKYNLDTQLFNIARTSLIDYVRQRSLLNKKFINLGSEKISDHKILPDYSFELSDYFNQAIKTLPPVRKKVFILSRLQGFSYQEIANLLSISINTVEDHMSKAIRHIKTVTFELAILFCFIF